MHWARIFFLIRVTCTHRYESKFKIKFICSRVYFYQRTLWGTEVTVTSIFKNSAFWAVDFCTLIRIDSSLYPNNIYCLVFVLETLTVF
jgi:hypothetical protein